MSSQSSGDGAPKADRDHGSKKRSRRIARRRAVLETKLAAADRLIEKRKKQLGAASERRASIAAKLAQVPGPSGTSNAPMAYCIKDRQRVAIGDAHVVVMANGRPAIAGVCPTCGSKVVRLGAA